MYINWFVIYIENIFHFFNICSPFAGIYKGQPDTLVLTKKKCKNIRNIHQYKNKEESKYQHENRKEELDQISRHSHRQ